MPPMRLTKNWGSVEGTEMTLKTRVKGMLENQLIPFWSGLRDDQWGGYYGLMDFDLRLQKQAEKSCILNSRILWFFSRCAKELKREDCLNEAQHAYQFLMDHCLDKEHGGVYWSLQYNGEPLDTTKHTYVQAFAVYALSAYYEASGDQKALETAQKLFRLMESRCRDTGGYLEAFDRDFKPASNEKLSENGVMAHRTMNTLLHVFEGYAGLYQASEDKEVRKAMEEILDIYAQKIFDPLHCRQKVFFDSDYCSLIDLHSYGHDIESSWLMDWGASLLKDEHLTNKIGQIDQCLASSIYERAYRDHSVLNECECGRNDTRRVWWVQAEAVLGFLNAWEKSGDKRFLDAAVDIWHYINDVLVDPRPGSEWFWLVDEKGAPDKTRPIVEPWKCPYHNGRMCLEILRRNWDVPC